MSSFAKIFSTNDSVFGLFTQNETFFLSYQALSGLKLTIMSKFPMLCPSQMAAELLPLISSSASTLSRVEGRL